MRLNEFVEKLTNVSRLLTSGSIPVTINGKRVKILEPTLEGENGDYWCNIQIEEEPKLKDTDAVCVCSYCGQYAIAHTDVMLTSNPAQYNVDCPNCGRIYMKCEDVNNTRKELYEHCCK